MSAPTTAIILCGGRGSRLGDLTKDCPKPLLKVGPGPFLDRLIIQLCHYKITRFVLVAGYLGHMIADAYTEWGVWHGLKIDVVVEENPRGTLPALWEGLKLVQNEPKVLVCNGDTLWHMNPTFFAFPAQGVQAFKIDGIDSGVRTVHSCRKTILKLVHEGKTSIEADLFPALGKDFIWRGMQGRFFDIGTPEAYARAQVIFR